MRSQMLLSSAVDAVGAGADYAMRICSWVAIEYLKSLACTRAILHASPSGKSIYAGLGFSETNEMKLDLQ